MPEGRHFRFAILDLRFEPGFVPMNRDYAEAGGERQPCFAKATQGWRGIEARSFVGALLKMTERRAFCLSQISAFLCALCPSVRPQSGRDLVLRASPGGRQASRPARFAARRVEPAGESAEAGVLCGKKTARSGQAGQAGSAARKASRGFAALIPGLERRVGRKGGQRKGGQAPFPNGRKRSQSPFSAARKASRGFAALIPGL